MTAGRISEADLIAFADGRLDSERAAEVAEWLRSVDGAGDRARVDAWRTQTALLRSTLDPIMSEPVPETLRDSLRRSSRPQWLISAMAAAILGVAVGIGGGWALWGPEPAVAREMADIGLSAHEVYIREVRHPVEVTVDDETHLVNWLSNRLDVAITPPDLTDRGLTLLGGRLIPEDGRPAAQLMYEDATGERFTLLIARSSEALTTAFRYAEGRTSGAYYWMAGTVGYVFAGPDDRDLLLALSREVYDQMI